MRIVDGILYDDESGPLGLVPIPSRPPSRAYLQYQHEKFANWHAQATKSPAALNTLQSPEYTKQDKHT